MKNKKSFKLNTLITPGYNKKFEKIFNSKEDAWYDLTVRVSAKDDNNWKISDHQVTLNS
jgi:hypothetical protein